MNYKIKLGFISGLGDVVADEIRTKIQCEIARQADDFIIIDFSSNFTEVLNLKSIQRAYIIAENEEYNPYYIFKHKSILGNLIDIVISNNKSGFKTFRTYCAGNDSPEVRNINKYITDTYKLQTANEADLKVHIVKNNNMWEIGVQMTPRPLSVRNYRVENMSGAMDPTIAYTVNSLCDLANKKSYLNIFSGSGTLLIEAGLEYPSLEKLIGFDNDKKNISLAIQNIKKAGLIRKIQLSEKDVMTKPEIGKFDVITSDLPFGMIVSKNKDLEVLYKNFIECAKTNLNKDGILVTYTSEYEMFEKIIKGSEFTILSNFNLKFVTNANSNLKTRILVCKFK